jgi:hypothetical protein
MLPHIQYADAHATAEAVRNAITGKMGKGPRDCMILPRSRFYPESTTWWVVPGKENPAYRYGKLYFDKADSDSSALQCGLHIEKGLGRNVPGPAGYTMDKRWTWNDFFPELDGEVEAQLAVLSRQIDGSPHVRLLAHLATEDAPLHSLRFESNDGALRLDGPGAERGTFLAPLASASSLAELRTRIAELPQLDWHWLNVTLGCDVRTQGNPASAETWDGAVLFESLLSPWMRWFH